MQTIKITHSVTSVVNTWWIFLDALILYCGMFLLLRPVLFYCNNHWSAIAVSISNILISININTFRVEACRNFYPSSFKGHMSLDICVKLSRL